MPLTDFVIRNYRSVRDIWLKLNRINVIVGPNGSGKSNLYRAIYLVASTATGRLARNLADEGGMASALRSGEFGRKEKAQISLSIKTNEIQYDLECGTVRDSRRDDSLFLDDLEIKSEKVHLFRNGVKSNILSRGRMEVTTRDAKGTVSDYTSYIPPNESFLSSLRDPHKYPHLFALREEFLNWRFYHHFRTDRQSPLRKTQLAVLTPMMAHDGSDLVSAIGTIFENGDAAGFLASLEDAFPGSRIAVEATEHGLNLQMEMQGIKRPFEARELSDGTLQYLCLLTAFYSLCPPSMLVINEPETSIHSDLMEPLARLITRASQDSQIWITTHSRELSDYILELSGYAPLELEKVNGETRLVGVGLGGYREPEDSDVDEETSMDPKTTRRS